jgi:hypothetical protein
MDNSRKSFSNVLGDCAPRSTQDAEVKSEAARKARIAALQEEIGAMHLANARYWNERSRSRQAVGEHQRRQDRLEEVRSELVELCLR